MLPGPGSYPLPAAIGSQPLARCNSLPKYSFGNQKQRANPANASCSPGPVYEPKGTRIGAMDRPKYSFSNDIRGKNPGGLRTPGPGAYSFNPALGTQVNSPYRTGMQIGFGTPSKGGRMVLPLEGRASPGPIYEMQGKELDPAVVVALARQVKLVLSILLDLAMAVLVQNGLLVLVLTTAAVVAADCILLQVLLAQEA